MEVSFFLHVAFFFLRNFDSFWEGQVFSFLNGGQVFLGGLDFFCDAEDFSKGRFRFCVKFTRCRSSTY